MTDATPMALPGFVADAPKGARKDADFYPTPLWLLEAIEPVLLPRLWAMARPQLVEPACGDGRMLRWLSGLVPGAPCVGFDVRRGAVEQTRAAGFTAWHYDWLSPGPEAHLPFGGDGAAFITNPPFSIGADFARACIRRAGAAGFTALLLRITFLEPTDDRAEFLAEHPCDVWVPTKRAQFTAGGNDSATTAWFFWPPEDPCTVGHRVRYLGRHEPDDAASLARRDAARRAMRGALVPRWMAQDLAGGPPKWVATVAADCEMPLAPGLCWSAPYPQYTRECGALTLDVHAETPDGAGEWFWQAVCTGSGHALTMVGGQADDADGAKAQAVAWAVAQGHMLTALEPSAVMSGASPECGCCGQRDVCDADCDSRGGQGAS